MKKFSSSGIIPHLFKDATWSCTVGKCKDKPKVFNNPEDFHRHLKKVHNA